MAECGASRTTRAFCSARGEVDMIRVLVWCKDEVEQPPGIALVEFEVWDEVEARRDRENGRATDGEREAVCRMLESVAKEGLVCFAEGQEDMLEWVAPARILRVEVGGDLLPMAGAWYVRWQVS